MPPLNLGLILLLSLPAVFLALVLSPQLRLNIQSAIPLRPGTKNPALRPDQPDVYCYGSITTVDDDDREFAPGCLSVNADGTFGYVLSLGEDGMPIAEEEMKKRGWEVDFGAHVVPGLWDGHAHLLQYGEMLGSVKLFDAASLEGLLSPLHPSASGERKFLTFLSLAVSSIQRSTSASTTIVPGTTAMWARAEIGSKEWGGTKPS